MYTNSHRQYLAGSGYRLHPPEALCCVQATNMMFVASLMMAIAVEHSGAHRRLSLHLITALGTGTSRIMLGRQSRDCRICANASPMCQASCW